MSVRRLLACAGMAVPNAVNLITRNLEEVLTREDLERLIASGTPLRH